MGQAKRRGSSRRARAAALFAEHSAKLLTRERYNAFVAWTRAPIAGAIGEEIEFFSTLNEHVLGVLIFDKIDHDYSWVTLGRDGKGRYRCVGVGSGLGLQDARHVLLNELKKHFDSGVQIFPQGDEDGDKAGIDLFTPVVGEEKFNPSFKLIRSGDHWIPARSIMNEMMRHFRDVDGNFVEQFQTTGFDARIWELYLYAALLEEGLYVDKPDPAPDFKVSLGQDNVFIEAVTVNPSAGEPIASPEDEPILRSPEEVFRLRGTKIPIKFGSALWSKLTRQKPYWEMKEVVGHPLVFAIADFHEKQSMTWTSTALINYLYGVRHDFWKDSQGKLVISPVKIEMHEHEGKRIPSGFFFQPMADNVSAVLFSSSGTISKFNRMGRLAGFGLSEQRLIRTGLRHKHDDNSALPEPFCFEVKAGEVTETWAEGLSMFHNPQAKYPVNHRLFPNIAHHFFEGGQIRSLLPEFHPYSSYTWNILPEKKRESSR